MQKTAYIWQNNAMVKWENATTHVMSHGLHYGSGVFEGIRCYPTANGPGIFKLKEHVARLFYSAAAIHINIPYSQTAICQAIIDTVAINQLIEGYIRPLAYYGAGKLRMAPDSALPIEMIIGCWELGAYMEAEMVDVRVSDVVRLHPQSAVTDAKICGNYVNSILAKLALVGTHYHEALLLDIDGNVAESASSNIFIVKNNIIYTPQKGKILPGITRDIIIQIAAGLGYTVKENQLTLDDVYQADEAFLTGTAIEVSPIHTINDKTLQCHTIGPITKILQEKYHALVRGECPEYKDDITIVKF